MKALPRAEDMMIRDMMITQDTQMNATPKHTLSPIHLTLMAPPKPNILIRPIQRINLEEEITHLDPK